MKKKRRKLNRKGLPKWTNCLTANEIWHLKDNMGSLTLKSFKNTRKKQKEWEDDWPGTKPCWDCHFIAKKLLENKSITKEDSYL